MYEGTEREVAVEKLTRLRSRIYRADANLARDSQTTEIKGDRLLFTGVIKKVACPLFLVLGNFHCHFKFPRIL